MIHAAKSLRGFIGAENFEESKSFYRDLGFIEHLIFDDMCYFEVTHQLGFYLQNYFNKDWINNSQFFLEVNNVDQYWVDLQALKLSDKYKNVRLTPIREQSWGKECFVHDPSGVLWHFGEFYV